MADYELNARKLLCPMPVIRTQDRIKSLQHGDVLTVTCTDRGVLHDIPAWCRVHGHEFLDSRTEGREIIVRVKVIKLG